MQVNNRFSSKIPAALAVVSFFLALFFSGGAPALADEIYHGSPAAELTGAADGWRQCSVEVEAFMKGMDAEGARRFASHLAWLYLPERDLLALVRAAAARGNAEALKTLCAELASPKWPARQKAAIAEALGRAAAREDGPAREAIAAALRGFIDTPECASSADLYSAVLAAVVRDGSPEGRALFFDRFSKAADRRVRRRAMQAMGGLGAEGLEKLRAELARLMKEGDHEEARAAAGVISSHFEKEAPAILAAAASEAEKAGAPLVLVFSLESLAASGDRETAAALAKARLAGPDQVTMAHGFELAAAAPKGGLSLVREIQKGSKKDSPEGRIFFRMMIDMAAGMPGRRGADCTAEAALAREVITEGLSLLSEPVTARRAFSAYLSWLRVPEFARLAAEAEKSSPTCPGSAGLLAVAGDTECFRAFLGRKDMAVECDRYSWVIAGESYRFEFTPAVVKAAAGADDSFFVFVALLERYMRERAVAAIVATHDTALVRRLAAFTAKCSPAFAESVRRAIVAEAAWLAEAGAPDLDEFSGLRGSDEYRRLVREKEDHEACGGDMRKYLLLVSRSGYHARDAVGKRLAAMIEKDPAAARAVLMDDLVPLAMKRPLFDAMAAGGGKGPSKAASALGEKALADIVANPLEDAEARGRAAALLAGGGHAAAFSVISSALAGATDEAELETALVRALGSVKTGESAAAIVERYVASRAAIAGDGEGDGMAGADDRYSSARRSVMYEAISALSSIGDAASPAADAAMAADPSLAGELGRFATKAALDRAFHSAYAAMTAEVSPAGFAAAFERVSATAVQSYAPWLVDAHRAAARGRDAAAAAVMLEIAGVPGPLNALGSSKDGALEEWLEASGSKGSARWLDALAGTPGALVRLEAAAGRQKGGPLAAAVKKRLDLVVRASDPAPVRDDDSSVASDEAFDRFAERYMASGAKTRVGLAASALARIDAIAEKGADRGRGSAARSFASVRPVLPFAQAASCAATLASARKIAPIEASEVLYEAGCGCEALSASYESAGVVERSRLVKAVRDRGSFDPAIFDPLAGHYFRSFESFAFAGGFDGKHHAKMAADKDYAGYEDSGHFGDLFHFSVRRSGDAAARSAALLEALSAGGYRGSALVSSYISSGVDPEASSMAAAGILADPKKAQAGSDVVSAAANGIPIGDLRGILTRTASDAKATVPWGLVEACFRRAGAADRDLAVSLLTGPNSSMRERAHEQAAALGREGFAVIRAAYEKLAPSEGGAEDAQYAVRDAGRAGGAEASSFLIGIIGRCGEKERYLKSTAVRELGHSPAPESFAWLLKASAAGGEGAREAFNALSELCGQDVFMFVDAVRGAQGKEKTLIASVLCSRGVRRPFLDIIASTPREVDTLDGEFLPWAGYSGSSGGEGTASRRIYSRAAASALAALAAVDPQDPRKSGMKNGTIAYLARFVRYSPSAEAPGALIALLDSSDGEIARSAFGSLCEMRATASRPVLAAASAWNGGPAYKRMLIELLREYRVRESAPVLVKAVSSGEPEVVRAACSAIGSLRVTQAIPALVGMLGDRAAGYHARDALTAMGHQAVPPLLDAMADNARSVQAYSALRNIVASSGSEDRRRIVDSLGAFLSAGAAFSGRETVLAALLLAECGDRGPLAAALSSSRGSLVWPGAGVFEYVRGAASFEKVRAAAVVPLGALAEDACLRDPGQAASAVSALSELGDTSSVALVSRLLKKATDQRLKRTMMDYLGKAGRDASAAYLAVLSGDGDAYMRRAAAEGLMGLDASAGGHADEILRIASGEKDQEVLWRLVRILGAAKHSGASARLVDIVRGGPGRRLSDETAKALHRLGDLGKVRSALASVIKESRRDPAVACAATVFGLYEDAPAAEMLCRALELSPAEGGHERKLSLLNALAGIAQAAKRQGGSDGAKIAAGVMASVGKATADPDPAVRAVARAVLASIADNDEEAARHSAPEPPSKIAASAGDGTATVTWTPPAGLPPASYDILRNGKKAGSAGRAATSFEDSGLANGSRCEYRVVVAGASGMTGAPSDAAVCIPSKPPGPVSGLSATRGNGRVTLSWGCDSQAGGAVAAFVVTRNGREVARLSPGETKFDDPCLSAGRSYDYCVYAVNSHGVRGLPARATGVPSFAGIKEAK